MVYHVEILLDVKVYHPLISLVEVFEGFLYRTMAISVRSEPITIVTEIFVISERQYLCCHLLYNSVCDCRYSERSLLAVGFRYVDPSYRSRSVFTFTYLSLQLFPLKSKIHVKFIYRHPIDSGCTFVSLDVLDCLVNIPVL